MLSRVADSLYWMSRYLERAEHTARIVYHHLNLDLEQPPETCARRWEMVLGGLHMDAALAAGHGPRARLDRLCFDHSERSSIVSCVMAARFNARQVREMISSEMWEQLNRLYHQVRPAVLDDSWDGEPVDFLLNVIQGCHFFLGLNESTMIHGEGWQFLRLGRHLERAQNMASMLDVFFRHSAAEQLDVMEWIGLLKCATAFEAYTKVNTAAVDPRGVAEFLALNEHFPHSLRFAVEEMHAALQAISETAPSRRVTRLLRNAGRLKASLGYAQPEEVVGVGIHGLLAEVLRQCNEIHSEIHGTFITYPVEATLEA